MEKHELGRDVALVIASMRNEVCIDNEGKRTERETWDNVGAEDIERFKLE
jgi:hypothetical protein